MRLKNRIRSLIRNSSEKFDMETRADIPDFTSDDVSRVVELFELAGFDRQDYLANNPDLEFMRGDMPALARHFLAHGMRECRTLKFRNSDAIVREMTQIDLSSGIRDLFVEYLTGFVVRRPLIDHESPLADLAQRHRDAFWLTPRDLEVTPTKIERILVVGSCLLTALDLDKHGDGARIDVVLTNNMANLGDPPCDPQSYDFQLVQIALRTVTGDALLWGLREGDLSAHQAMFDHVCQRLSLQLKSLMEWNARYGIPTFVLNFLVPQANPCGRLMRRYDLCNPAYFIERLNGELEAQLAEYKNAYLLDIDKIASSIGRRYVQDDSLGNFAHNSLLSYTGPLEGRMEPLAPMDQHLDVKWSPHFQKAVWVEAVAMLKTLRQTDMVKLVVVDLDDTLWNGISGEDRDVDPAMIEGWPLGLAEALAFLKRRGVLLAIASKNDEQRIRDIWKTIFYDRLSLDDFAVIKINWQPKAENMLAILAETNLLPRNTIFIDDNPVERAAMKHAFPDMRILGKYPYYLRRILLWSPETQVVSVTDESARRTEMIKSQVQRETERKQLSRQDFLSSLGLRVKIYPITDTAHPKFPRAFELLNKTNQFNTTGRRWRPDEMQAAFDGGAALHAFEAEDRFSAYGLIGVIVASNSRIEQMVMSCRVVGLDVEQAVLSHVMSAMKTAGHGRIEAAFEETDANLLCRDLYRKAAFELRDGMWCFEGPNIPKPPSFITIL